jgi:hypothetical protein
MSALDKLQDWYAHQCDGNWEHTYGIKLDTLDNPGWWLRVELTDTVLEDREFTASSYGMDNNEGDSRWLFCTVAENTFDGSAGPRQLEELINVFLKWSGASDT